MNVKIDFNKCVAIYVNKIAVDGSAQRRWEACWVDKQYVEKKDLSAVLRHRYPRGHALSRQISSATLLNAVFFSDEVAAISCLPLERFEAAALGGGKRRIGRAGSTPACWACSMPE